GAWEETGVNDELENSTGQPHVAEVGHVVADAPGERPLSAEIQAAASQAAASPVGDELALPDDELAASADDAAPSDELALPEEPAGPSENAAAEKNAADGHAAEKE